MSFAIRRLTPDDGDAYRAIRHEALVSHPEAFLSDAQIFAQTPDSQIARTLEALTIFGAFLPDGTLGGINAYLRADNPKERHRGWLLQVYTKPRHRGTGLSQALCEHLIAHAQGEVKQIHLGVWTENLPAIRLYQKLGFSIYGTEPRYLFVNGRYCDEHLMVRFFDKAPGDPNE